jgi:biotin operon repressor
MVQRQRNSAPIMDYLVTRRNEYVTLTEIVKATGIDRQRVMNAISQLRGRNGVNIETISKGSTYVLREGSQMTKKEDTPSRKLKKVFEEIGATREGDLIIQADDGTLWKAVQL